MMKQPPMYPTNMRPEEIIGPNNIDIFRKHYAICQAGTNGGEFPSRRLNKEVGEDNRPHIAACLARLRDHGFVPNGFKDNGEIQWMVVTKSKSQQLMEKGLPALKGKSIKELQKIARSYYPLIGKEVEHVTEYEIEREKLKDIRRF